MHCILHGQVLISYLEVESQNTYKSILLISFVFPHFFMKYITKLRKIQLWSKLQTLHTLDWALKSLWSKSFKYVYIPATNDKISIIRDTKTSMAIITITANCKYPNSWNSKQSRRFVYLPEKYARCVLYCCSREKRYINGCCQWRFAEETAVNKHQ